MPTIIGVDPGQTTGVVMLSVDADALLGAKHTGDGLQHHIRIERSFQVDCTPPWENKGAETIANLAIGYANAAIACEDFIIDFKKIDQQRSTLSPVRIIAKIEYALWRVGAEYSDKSAIGDSRINFQSASLAKTTCTDERLKEWGLYDRTSGVHARDAMRHAFFFLRACRGNSIKAAEKRWKAWPHIYPDPQIRPNPARNRKLGDRIEGL